MLQNHDVAVHSFGESRLLQLFTVQSFISWLFWYEIHETRSHQTNTWDTRVCVCECVCVCVCACAFARERKKERERERESEIEIEIEGARERENLKEREGSCDTRGIQMSASHVSSIHQLIPLASSLTRAFLPCFCPSQSFHHSLHFFWPSPHFVWSPFQMSHHSKAPLPMTTPNIQKRKIELERKNVMRKSKIKIGLFLCKCLFGMVGQPLSNLGWMSDVTYKWVISHVNDSCHEYMSHVTFAESSST